VPRPAAAPSPAANFCSNNFREALRAAEQTAAVGVKSLDRAIENARTSFQFQEDLSLREPTDR
jgi:hypothetical protein